MNTCTIIFLLTLGTQSVFGNGRIALNNYQRRECPEFDDPNVNLHLPHESDCTLFYHCSNGEKHLTRCPPGLHFNPETETCDYPAHAGCIHIGTSSTSSTLITTENPPTSPSTSSPSTASPSTASPSTASPSTASPSTASPSTVSPSTASPSTVSPSTASPSTVSPSTASPSTASPSTASPSSTSTVSASTAEDFPASCPAVDPDTPVLLPHECACQKYYLCSSGFQILQKCPLNYHFNPSTRNCETPENAQCSPSTSSDLPVTLSTSSEIPVTPSTSSEIPVTPSTSSDAPVTPSTSSDVPVTPSTSSDIPVTPSTSSDIPVTPSTSSDIPVTPSTSSDIPVTPSTSSDVPVTPSTSSDIPVTPSTSSDIPVTPSTPIPIIPTECPATNEGKVVHLPHKTDCSLFYKCDSGEKVIQQCPKGLNYNAILQVCDYPFNVDCSINFRP